MAITDNTAKWQVKKLTNFTDKDREIATQAQAEEGVDNTKVMTPLRVKQAVAKCDAKNIVPVLIKDGTDLDTCTDVNFLYKSDGNGTYLNSPVAQGQAFTLEVLPWGGENARFIQRITDNTSKNNIYVRGRTGVGGFGTWKKIFNNSDIATQAQAEAGTDNTTVMTPLRTAQYNALHSLDLSGANIYRGDMKASKDHFQFCKTIDTGTTYIYGGTGTHKGAFLYLSGIDNPTAGTFELSCISNTTSRIALTGRPDGSLTWAGKKVATNGALSMPSGNKIDISVTAGQETHYVAPADGYICVRFSGAGIGYLLSGGNNIVVPCIGYNTNDINSDRVGVLPILKGKTVGIYIPSSATITNCNFVYAQSEV